MNYRVTAHRDAGWWLITAPELDIVTQARRAADVEPMARDLIATWLDTPPESVEVTVELELPDGLKEQASAARERVHRAEAERRAAAEESRAIARALADSGLGVRDVGQVLGVSYQRAGQLIGVRRH